MRMLARDGTLVQAQENGRNSLSDSARLLKTPKFSGIRSLWDWVLVFLDLYNSTKFQQESKRDSAMPRTTHPTQFDQNPARGWFLKAHGKLKILRHFLCPWHFLARDANLSIRQIQVMSTLPLKAISRLWGQFNELTIPYYLRVPGFKLYSFIFGVKSVKSYIPPVPLARSFFVNQYTFTVLMRSQNLTFTSTRILRPSSTEHLSPVLDLWIPIQMLYSVHLMARSFNLAV